jgi:hypothetical protein
MLVSFMLLRVHYACDYIDDISFMCMRVVPYLVERRYAQSTLLS